MLALIHITAEISYTIVNYWTKLLDSFTLHSATAALITKRGGERVDNRPQKKSGKSERI
jgi:hypothetical protein